MVTPTSNPITKDESSCEFHSATGFRHAQRIENFAMESSIPCPSHNNQHKLDQLRIMLQDKPNETNVLGVTETWFCSKYQTADKQKLSHRCERMREELVEEVVLLQIYKIIFRINGVVILTQ